MDLSPAIYQVILNKDVSYQPDPILLEEPSHVMLNHIYAQVNKTLYSPFHKKRKYSLGNQGWFARTFFHSEIQEEICNNAFIQTYWLEHLYNLHWEIYFL